MSFVSSEKKRIKTLSAKIRQVEDFMYNSHIRDDIDQLQVYHDFQWLIFKAMQRGFEMNVHNNYTHKVECIMFKPMRKLEVYLYIERYTVIAKITDMTTTNQVRPRGLATLLKLFDNIKDGTLHFG